jgi:hypothetical protein
MRHVAENRPFVGTRPIPLWPWSLIGIVTIPLAIAALVVFDNVSGFVLFGDAEWYATSLPRLFSDVPLYPPDKLQPHELGFPQYWNQPPTTALFSLGLLLPGDRWTWGLIMVAFTLIGLGILWPRVGPGGVFLLLPVLLVWLPVPSALAWANVNAMVFCLLAIAWRFPRSAGWAIGIAAAVKLVPILGVAWLIGKRDWRGAGIAVGILLAATAIIVVWKGPSTLSDFVVLRLNEVTPLAARPRWNPIELLNMPDWIAFVLAAGIAAVAIVRASLSLSIIAMIVSSPALHAHYLIWLLVPILGIWLPWIIARLQQQSAVGVSLVGRPSGVPPGTIAGPD